MSHLVLTENDGPLDASTISEWSIAKKVKPIRAKPLVSILVDKSVLSKLLVTTLEANEKLGDGVVICVGEAGDIWQQMPKKLLAKYDVTAIDPEGWMVCEPKPDNSIECYEVKAFINTHSGEHYVKAQWGADFRGQTCQAFGEGDFICRNREDHSDVWVVRKKLFNNTYTIIGEHGGHKL